MTIFVLKTGNRLGPFTVEQVAVSIQKGELLMTDLAWHEGMSEWKQIQNLAAIVQAVLPPSPERALIREQRPSIDQTPQSKTCSSTTIVPEEGPFVGQKNILQDRMASNAGIQNNRESDKARLQAIMMCLFLQGFGAHGFYVGHKKTAVVIIGVYVFAIIACVTGNKTLPDFLSVAGILSLSGLLTYCVKTAIKIGLGKSTDGAGRKIVKWNENGVSATTLMQEFIISGLLGGFLWVVYISTIVTVISALFAHHN